jgi:hypothetical protein
MAVLSAALCRQDSHSVAHIAHSTRWGCTTTTRCRKSTAAISVIILQTAPLAGRLSAVLPASLGQIVCLLACTVPPRL